MTIWKHFFFTVEQQAWKNVTLFIHGANPELHSNVFRGLIFKTVKSVNALVLNIGPEVVPPV